MIQTNKIAKIILFLLSINLLGQNLSLRIQSEIPTIFKDGMEEILSQSYENIFFNKININECETNECLANYSEQLHASAIISIKVYPIDESKLKFKAKFIDFENEKIISKVRYFKIDNEKALFLFGKRFAQTILKDEKEEKKRVIEIENEEITKIKEHKVENNNDIEKYDSSDWPEIKPKIALRKKYNLGFTGGVGGSNGLGINFDWFINENLNLEVSTIGILPIVLGLNLFFTPERNLSPYVGFHVAPFAFYIPIGFQYISDKGFTFSAEVGIMSIYIYNQEVLPWGGLKIGYHF